MSAAAPCRVLVLRPMPGNADTVGRLAALGIVAAPLPLFAVEPVTWEVPSSESFDALLLTSANAVRHAGQGLAALDHLPVWCVGEATATAARDAGLTVARVGSGGVAALVSGTADRLLWLCGEERSALPEEAERQVTVIPVYRTRALLFPASVLAEPCVALLHSARAARRFAQLASERASIAIVAISEVVAAAAGEGWNNVAIATRPDDAEMVAIAAKLCQDGSRGAR